MFNNEVIFFTPAFYIKIRVCIKCDHVFYYVFDYGDDGTTFSSYNKNCETCRTICRLD